MKFYKPIPFLDAPEAVYVESITRKRGLVNAAAWAKLFPFMLCLDPQGVQAVLTNWKKQCRQAEDECNVQLETVSTIIKQLDEIAKGVVTRP